MEVNENFSEKAQRDYELVQQAITGDQKAYAELMGYYKDALYFMLLRMVNNKSDAEDLAIEAFGKAFKNIENYTPDFAFSTWLFKIASNNGIDFLRRKKSAHKHISIDNTETYKEQNDFDSTLTLKSANPDPEEKIIIKQKEKLLKTVISKLNPRYKKLIELRYFKDYSYFEIAEELNIPVGTVKARLFRSRNLLLNTLKNNNKDLF